LIANGAATAIASSPALAKTGGQPGEDVHHDEVRAACAKDEVATQSQADAVEEQTNDSNYEQDGERLEDQPAALSGVHSR